MPFRLLADLVLVVHVAFVAFVTLGGLLVLRWPRLVWAHLPAVAWGVLIEVQGWICPLTPLENALRRRAGEVGYEGGFIDHYLLPLLYPHGLTRQVQLVLAGGLLAVNAAVYAVVLRRRAARRPAA